jgi:hypothetical protein
VKKFLLLFRTTRDTIKAEKACRNNNLECRAIPVPRHLSAECGIALEIDEPDQEEALRLLRQENIDVTFAE